MTNNREKMVINQNCYSYFNHDGSFIMIHSDAKKGKREKNDIPTGAAMQEANSRTPVRAGRSL